MVRFFTSVLEQSEQEPLFTYQSQHTLLVCHPESCVVQLLVGRQEVHIGGRVLEAQRNKNRLFFFYQIFFCWFLLNYFAHVGTKYKDLSCCSCSAFAKEMCLKSSLYNINESLIKTNRFWTVNLNQEIGGVSVQLCLTGCGSCWPERTFAVPGGSSGSSCERCDPAAPQPCPGRPEWSEESPAAKTRNYSGKDVNWLLKGVVLFQAVKSFGFIPHCWCSEGPLSDRKPL